MNLSQQAHDRLVKQLASRLSKQSGKRASVYRTHISSVIVCGKRAYKLKRPVKLPFVDFSTLTFRHEDCEREMHINRLAAPTLYLGVVKITGTPQAPRINGAGPTLDWAVLMRRFDQTALLSHLIEYDGISSQDAESLGRYVAHQISQRPALKAHVTEGHRPAIDWLQESLNEITGIYADLLPEASAIEQWAKSQAKQHHTLIEQRRKAGCYRDCHGDLHLGNLLKLGKKIVAFDALEFNRDLSQIDAVSDIAFAFMDFLAHDRSDLAWSMINQWCEVTKDYEALLLLRYYTLYRAVVRAKVAALTNRNTRGESFERYWRLANRLVKPANAPRLTIVAGLSGSGKSTVARALVGKRSAIQLRADIIRKHLFTDLLNDPKRLYSKVASKQTYSKLAAMADQLLKQNLTVVVDATFLVQEHVDQFSELADKHKITLEVIWCEAPLPIMKRRIKQRAKLGRDPSDADAAVLDQQIRQFESHPVCWPHSPYRIDTNATRAKVRVHIDQLL